MAHPLSKCANCGLVFESRIIAMEMSMGTFENIGESCPRCHGTASILPGTFNEVGRGVEYVAGPASTKSAYDAFRDLIREAQDGGLTPRQVQERAAEIDPEIGQAVAKLMLRFPRTFVFIIAMVLIMRAMNLQPALDLNRLTDQIIEYVDQKAGDDPTSLEELSEDELRALIDQKAVMKAADKRMANPPSETRRKKNKSRRIELKNRRGAFNPR
jgi:transcription initiation factor TFIIIB Brf1 subunit/transcription initiation factor TFIIB